MVEVKINDCSFFLEEYYDFITDKFKDNKLHEPNATRCLLDRISKDDVFFDVGANIGYYSLVASCFTDKVHAFDCNKYAYSVVENFSRLNNRNIQINCNIVSNESGYGCVAIYDYPKRGLSLQTTGDYEIVRQIKLDDYGVIPTFVKIDVEGAEGRVLEGMLEILESKPKLMIEVHNKWKLQSFDYSFSDIRKLLSGYSIYVINDFRENINYRLVPIEEFNKWDENFMIYAE